MREANDKRVNITLSEKLLDQIDRRARRDGLSRSGLVREALEAYLAESSRLLVGLLGDQLEGAWAALGRARVLADWDRAPALDQASGWRMALQHAVVRLADTRIEWLVIGSAASALQGVEIEPRDVDLLFRTREDLMAFVRKMHGLTPSSPEAPLSVEDWRSSQAQPIKTETFPGAFTWHKAAWDIEGVRLDATAIENNGVPDSLHGDGVWEGGDPSGPLSRGRRTCLWSRWRCSSNRAFVAISTRGRGRLPSAYSTAGTRSSGLCRCSVVVILSVCGSTCPSIDQPRTQEV